MERCLLSYFVLNNELKNSCEFNPDLFLNTISVYEVIRVEQGVPLFLQDHINRFFNSLLFAGIKSGISEKQIHKSIKALIEANGMQLGLIKFIYTNQPAAGNLFAAWVMPFFFPSRQTYQTGIRIMSYNGNREKPTAKISQQTIRKQSDKLIKENNVYEILLINRQGFVTEGSRSNLFFVNQGILFTAHSNLVLKGVTRQKIIDLALESGIDVLESVFNLTEIADFEAAFITGTSPKVLPVKLIDHVNYNTLHPVTQHLFKKYNSLIERYILNFSW